MDGRDSSMPVNAPPRPYRSKRHRPCDICRRRKHACYVDQRPPCRNCRELGVECTFNDPPSKRRRPGQGPEHRQEREREQGHTELRPSIPPFQLPLPLPPTLPLPSPPTADSELQSLHRPDPAIAGGLEDLLIDVEDTRSHLLHPVHDDLWYLASLWDSTFPGFEVDSALDHEFGGNNSYPQDSLFERVNVQNSEQQSSQPPQLNTTTNAHVRTQPLRSLDILDKSISVQYLGLSGAVDPFLLRHMRFSDDGVFDFGQFQYRRVAERSAAEGHFSSTEQIPAHFMINSLKQNGDNIPILTQDSEPKQMLEKLVTVDLQARLVGLLVAFL